MTYKYLKWLIFLLLVSVTSGCGFLKSRLKLGGTGETCEDLNPNNNFCEYREHFCSTEDGRKLVAEVLGEADLDQNQCVSEATVDVFKVVELNLLADASGKNQPQASLDNERGRFYVLRSKHNDNLCLTASANGPNWSLCEDEVTNPRQQFHFLLRESISHIRWKSYVTDETVFKLISAHHFSTQEADERSCLSIGSGAGLSYENCSTSSYFMLPASRWGHNQGLPDSITQGQSSQEKNRYVSLIALSDAMDNKVTAQITKMSDLLTTIDEKKVHHSWEAEENKEIYSENGWVCDGSISLNKNIPIPSYSMDDPTPLCSHSGTKGEDRCFATCLSCESIKSNLLMGGADNPLQDLVDFGCKYDEIEEKVSLQSGNPDPVGYHISTSGGLKSVQSFKDDVNSQQDNKDLQISLEECYQIPSSSEAICSKSAPSIKKLADYENGNATAVFQIKQINDEKKCARIEENGNASWGSCADKRLVDSTHFTRESGAQISGLTILRFRSEKSTDYCLNIAADNSISSFKCDDDQSGNLGNFDIDDFGSFTSTERNNRVQLHPCALISDDTESGYDCNYEKPKRLIILDKLAMALGFGVVLVCIALSIINPGMSSIAIGLWGMFFSIPSFVMDGVLCSQNENNIAKQSGCMALAIGIPAEIVIFGLLDASTIPSRVLSRTRRILKNTPITAALDARKAAKLTGKLAKNAKLHSGLTELNPERAFRLPIVKSFISSNIDREAAIRILKRMHAAAKKEAEKIGIDLDSLRVGKLNSDEAIEAFIDNELIHDIDDYLAIMGKRETLNAPQSTWKSAINEFLYNAESIERGNIELLQAGRARLSSETSDAIKDAAFIVGRNRDLARREILKTLEAMNK